MHANPDQLLHLDAAAPFRSSGGQEAGRAQVAYQGKDTGCTRGRRRGADGETAALLRPGVTTGWS
jgi:hypothetical protein